VIEALTLPESQLIPSGTVPNDNPSAIVDHYVRLTPVGAEFLGDEPMPIEAYGWLCDSVGRGVVALRWFIGDLLAYGERHYGETYAQFQDAFGCGYHTLQQYRRVSARIPLEERRAEVNWTAYQITAHLEPETREALLDAYLIGAIGSTDELRDEVRQLGVGEDCELLPACPKCGGKLTSRKCKGCGLDFPQAVWWLKELLKGED